LLEFLIALSLQGILGQDYAVVRKEEGGVVRRVASLEASDALNSRASDGEFSAEAKGEEE